MKKVPCHKKRGIFETPFNDLEYYVGHAVNSTFVISFVKYVGYPRVRFAYFLCRFVRQLAPSLTMMAPDRARRALSIALVGRL